MTPEELNEYRRFRTGLTFRDVRQMLWSYDDDPKTWRHVTRRTVLGKWREIKLKMWSAYQSAKEA